MLKTIVCPLCKGRRPGCINCGGNGVIMYDTKEQPRSKPRHPPVATVKKTGRTVFGLTLPNGSMR